MPHESDIPELETRPIGRDDQVEQRERSRVGIRPVRSKEVRSLDGRLSRKALEEIKAEVDRREESIVERAHPEG